MEDFEFPYNERGVAGSPAIPLWRGACHAGPWQGVSNVRSTERRVKGQGAGGETRTPMGFRPRPCQDPASTSCATPAPPLAIGVIGNPDAAQQRTVPLAGANMTTSGCCYVTGMTRRVAKERQLAML